MTALGGPAGVLMRVPAALSVLPPPPHCPFTEDVLLSRLPPSEVHVFKKCLETFCMPSSLSLSPSFPPLPFPLLFIKFVLRNHSICGCFSFLGCEAPGGLSLGPQVTCRASEPVLTCAT